MLVLFFFMLWLWFVDVLRWCCYDVTSTISWGYRDVVLVSCWWNVYASWLLCWGLTVVILILNDTEMLSLWRHCDVIFSVASMLRWSDASMILLCMCMLSSMWFWYYADVSLRFRWSWFELMFCCVHATLRLRWCNFGISVMLFWCYLQGILLCSLYCWGCCEVMMRLVACCVHLFWMWCRCLFTVSLLSW